MALDLHYHVVQYVEDPLIGEGRNVAILAHHLGKGYFRALGVNGYHLAPSHFKSLSPKAHESFWAYREWVECFRSVSAIRSSEQFDEIISRLGSRSSGLVASGEGVLELSDGHIIDPTDAMDYLFQRLVRTPKIPPILAFEDRVADLFMRVEVGDDEHFWDEAVEVEMISDNGEEVINLEFSHLLTGDNPIGFNTLVLQGATKKSLARQIERITTTFRNAVKTGYLQQDRCILLCGKVSETHRDFLSQLSGLAEVMDVFNESTVGRIRKLVWPYS
ncbi:MAG TPA: hypothetical protein VMW07_04590 [Gallionella sp.]|nr:hypothetical protein [Gallionella sp.]